MYLPLSASELIPVFGLPYLSRQFYPSGGIIHLTSEPSPISMVHEQMDALKKKKKGKYIMYIVN